MIVDRKKEEAEKVKKINRDRPNEVYTQPQPILESDFEFEKMDRGEGTGVDDVKTYHATGK